jgi:uncharacterized protein YjbJ (UPF0337 family)
LAHPQSLNKAAGFAPLSVAGTLPFIARALAYGVRLDVVKPKVDFRLGTHRQQWSSRCLVGIEVQFDADPQEDSMPRTRCDQGGCMKPSTTDQIQGKLHEMKGKVKEKAGQVTNNPGLAAEGQDEKLAGKVQKKVGQIEKVFEK